MVGVPAGAAAGCFIHSICLYTHFAPYTGLFVFSETKRMHKLLANICKSVLGS